MKRFVFPFLLAFFFSCSENEKTILIEDEQDKLKVNYLGYWESITHGLSKVEIFDNLIITPKTIKVSTNEDIKVLQIFATNNDDESFIEFTILANTIGTDVLYNRHLNYKVFWPKYNLAEDVFINFNVEENNETSLKLKFSGTLVHWNEGTQNLQRLVIHDASLTYNY